MAEPHCRLIVVFVLVVVVILLYGLIFGRHLICHSTVSSELTGSGAISEACLQCICEAQVTCEPAECRARRMCTNFRISQSYWTAAGLPTVEGAPDGGENSELAYVRCVGNPFCAARAVRGYVSRHLSDCDGDGVLSCYDYARIHLYGHEECARRNFTDDGDGSVTRLRQCLELFLLK